MYPGRAIREALTLEREKDMELNSLMQALAKDLAEQMRPMVAEMVRSEMAATASQLADISLSNEGMADIAERIGLAHLAKYINLADLAGELTDSQLTIIAGDVDLADLARELDVDNIAEKLDVADAIREFFQDNTFSIRT